MYDDEAAEVDWTLLMTLPETSDPIAFVYILPAAFDGMGRLLRFEEVGGSNFIAPHGLAQWYAHEATEASGEMFRIRFNASGGEEPVDMPVVWHSDGYGVAAFPLAEEMPETQAWAKLYAGPVLLGAVVADLRDDVDSLSNGFGSDFVGGAATPLQRYRYRTGGTRLIRRALGYKRVFVSYSRKDRKIVELVDSVTGALREVDFPWDLEVLQSGDYWEASVREEIRCANALQLLWSANARNSAQVEREWRYALSLNREHFIEGIYWEEPMPSLPSALQNIHFGLYKIPTTW